MVAAILMKKKKSRYFKEIDEPNKPIELSELNEDSESIELSEDEE